jgi:ferredoxin--NADP+ reductase
MTEPQNPRPLIAIIGGAVAGSEAARMAAERGARVVVFEQNPRPYGKIEDGLPCWHASLREKEFGRIDGNFDHPDVVFVPETRIGRDLAWEALTRELGFSAVVLANGAWRDRPLPVPGVEDLLGRGFLYQNPFVMAFNRGESASLPPVVDDAIVIGGGLASIDVCKILSFRSYAAALAARGVTLDPEQFDKKGIAAICEAAGVDLRELGLRGPTLFYRRRAEDMPLVSADDGDSSRAAKLAQTRVRILEKAMEKYAFRFEPLASPVGVVVGEGGALAGLRFQRNAMQDGRLAAVPGEVFEARGPLVIASIGSVPAPIPGVPMDGELYRWRDPERGELATDFDGGARLFGLGNVLTGKGNIVESRRNAKKIMDLVTRDALGLGGEAPADDGTAAAGDVARVVEGAVAATGAPAAAHARVEAWVAARHAALGFVSYASWLAAHPVTGHA